MRACGSAVLQVAEAAETLAALDEAEGLAKRAHRGMFEYGDPGDEDEEDAPPAWGRR